MTTYGSCLCGAVTYQVEGELSPVVYCHCRQCQKQSGLYYAATSCANGAISIDGGTALKWYRASADAQRGFCGTCGSSLFWRHDKEDHTSILAGSLDQPTGLTSRGNIFVEDKGDFYELPEV